MDPRVLGSPRITQNTTAHVYVIASIYQLVTMTVYVIASMPVTTTSLVIASVLVSYHDRSRDRKHTG